MSLETLDLQYLGDLAYNAIRDAITSGRLEPGAKLSQDTLAGQLGVSRAPVRDALNRLEAEGFVKTVSRKGVVVAAMTTEELLEIFAVRVLVDAYAAGLACRNMTDSDIARLEQVVGRMDDVSKTEDLNGIVQAHGDFHLVIYSTCGNAELSRIAQNLWARSYRYRLTGLTKREIARLSFEDHAAVLEALKKRDPFLAEEAMANDIRHTIERLLAQMSGTTAIVSTEPSRAPLVMEALKHASALLLGHSAS